MKQTFTILFALLVMAGFASCMSTTNNRNHNPASANLPAIQWVR